MRNSIMLRMSAAAAATTDNHGKPASATQAQLQLEVITADLESTTIYVGREAAWADITSSTGKVAASPQLPSDETV